MALCQVPALAQSLQEMTWRHEVFRTTFVNIAGQPFQVIGQTVPMSLPVVDLLDMPEAEQKAQVHTLAQAEVQQRFDLSAGPFDTCHPGAAHRRGSRIASDDASYRL